MKKILIFSVSYHPFIGGAEVAVKEITDRIADCEFDMITLNLDGNQPSTEKVGNVIVYRIGGRGRFHKLLYPFAARWFALKLHKKRNYDAIWSIMASFSGFAALFFNYSKKNVRFILTLQEGDPIDYIKRQVWFVYPLFKQIFMKADTIQAISNYLALFAKDMGARVEPIVIPNGVDLTIFAKDYSDAELEQARKEIGKMKGERILITTSRLVVKNGVGDLIESLVYLPHSVKLAIIGGGELEAQLRLTVDKLHLSERVIFLGEKKNKDVPPYLKASDVFVRPSLSEGLGVSFIEAMAARIPVVATPVGGIPEFLKEGETGIFCNPHDPKSIAESVKKILENHELASRLTSHACMLVEHRYSWDTIAQEMAKILT